MLRVEDKRLPEQILFEGQAKLRETEEEGKEEVLDMKHLRRRSRRRARRRNS